MTNGTDTLTEKTPTIKLWNPQVVVYWSILFTPIFGAWLQAKNWTELNKEDKADKSMKWMYAGIGLILFSIFFIPEKASRGLNLIFILLWYFYSAKEQILFLTDNNISYTKKEWMKPILSAIAILISFIILGGLFGNDDSSTKCSDSETKNLVLEIAKEELTEQEGKTFSDLINLNLSNIRTVDYNEKTGSKQCDAELELTSDDFNKIVDISYNVDFVDKNHDLYVTVYGLNYLITPLMEAINNKIISDSIEQYNIAKNEGDSVQICVRAMAVSAAYMQVKNSQKYEQWQAIVSNYCN